MMTKDEIKADNELYERELEALQQVNTQTKRLSEKVQTLLQRFNDELEYLEQKYGLDDIRKPYDA